MDTQTTLPGVEVPPPESAAIEEVPPLTATQAYEDLHLAAEHALVKVTAYIKDETKAKAKTQNAQRVAKHRQKVRDAGFIAVPVPVEIADAVKQTEGGFPAWLDRMKATAAAPQSIEKIVEVRVPAELNTDQVRQIELGQRVENLIGWRRGVANWLLK